MRFSKRPAAPHTCVQPEPKNLLRYTLFPNDNPKKYKKYLISTLQLSIDGSKLAKKIALFDCLIAYLKRAKFEGKDDYV